MKYIEENLLIEKCRMGERDCFGPLINLYRRPLFSYLFKLSGDRTSAEDLFQETMIKVWRALPKFNNAGKFSSWIFSIAHNTAMDHLRKKIKKRNMENTTDEIDIYPDRGNPFTELVKVETSLMIGKAVNKLSDKQKNVLLLRIHGQMSFKEIANLTGEPLNTVISHMRYAVIKLKKYVREYDAE